jgi:hypothetical protein
MHGLRLSNEAVGDRAEHLGAGLANLYLPAMQKGSAPHHRKHRDRGLVGAKEVKRRRWQSVQETRPVQEQERFSNKIWLEDHAPWRAIHRITVRMEPRAVPDISSLPRQSGVPRRIPT